MGCRRYSLYEIQDTICILSPILCLSLCNIYIQITVILGISNTPSTSFPSVPAGLSPNFPTLSDRTVTPSISQGRVLHFDTMSSNVGLTEENYLFKVDLLGVKNPEISRTISCPATTKFDDFDQALQVAFKWHLPSFYRFGVFYPLAKAKDFRLKYLIRGQVWHRHQGLGKKAMSLSLVNS